MNYVVWAVALLALAAPTLAEKHPAPPDIHVTGSNLEQNIHCEHNALYLTGSNSRLSVEGDCTTVYVQGSRNFVEVQDANWIRTSGSLNSVLYLNPGTRVSDAGKGNSVSLKWQQ